MRLLLYISILFIVVPALCASAEESGKPETSDKQNGKSEGQEQKKTPSTIEEVQKTEEESRPLLRGTAPFFGVTNAFLDLVQPADKTFNNSGIDVLKLSVNPSGYVQNNYKIILEHYTGFTACLVFGVLFMIIMPIVGFIFCICRCCGACGGDKRRIMDPKNAKCKRISCNIILAVIATFMLAGVVNAYIASDLVHRQLVNANNQGLVNSVNSSLSTVEQYVDENIKVLVENVNKISGKVNSTVDDIIELADQVVEKIKDVALGETQGDLFDTFKLITGNQSQIIKSISSFDVAAAGLKRNQIASKISSSKTDITNTLGQCAAAGEQACTGAVDTANKLDPTNYPDTSDIDQKAGNLKKYNESMQQPFNDIEKGVSDAKKKYNDISSKIEEKLQPIIDEANKGAKDVINKVNPMINDVRKTIDTALNFKKLKKSSTEHLTKVKSYAKYYQYFAISFCSFLLLTILLVYCGLSCGICGARANRRGDCCNRSTGGCCLLASVGLIFIFSSFLMLIITILFLPGGFIYTELCRTLKDPTAGYGLKRYQPIADKYVREAIDNNEKVTKNIPKIKDYRLDLTTLFKRCKANNGLIKVFQLEDILPLDDAIDTINEKVKPEIEKVKDIDFSLSDIELVSKDLNDSINNINSDIRNELTKQGVDLQKMKKNLETNSTAGLSTLNSLIVELETIANLTILDANSKNKLQTERNKLVTLRDQTIPNILTLQANALKSLIDLNNSINYIQALSVKAVDDAIKVTNLIKNKGVELGKQVLKETAPSILNTLITTVNTSINFIANELGQCSLAYAAYLKLVYGSCNLVIDPFNLFWASSGWCVVLYIPCLIASIYLSILYYKREEYISDYIAETHMDDFEPPPYRDNIPLNRLRPSISVSPMPPAAVQFQQQHAPVILVPPHQQQQPYKVVYN